MFPIKVDILNRLRTEILPLEGLGTKTQDPAMDLGLEFMAEAFPNGHIPLGAVHELISEGVEAAASTAGFTAALLSGLMKSRGPVVWIGHNHSLFPPALKVFDILPDQVIFINLLKEKDILWVTQEALKCPSLSGVICEIPELNFTNSRRFQLAVEQSKTTGFILRSNPRSLSPNSCIARWRIKPLASFAEHGLPGLGYPRWKLDLLKIRNGRPGSWEVEWIKGKFQQVSKSSSSLFLQSERKTG